MVQVVNLEPLFFLPMMTYIWFRNLCDFLNLKSFICIHKFPTFAACLMSKKFYRFP